MTVPREVLDELVELAFDFLEGRRGVARDPETAAKLFRIAGDAGSTRAQVAVARQHLSGDGVTKDIAVARQWFEMAAGGGNVRAQNQMGKFYLKGDTVEQDYAEAMRWFQMAEEQGSLFAAYNIALMYKGGKGVEQDSEEAARRARILADRGYAYGQAFFAERLAKGDGVEKDPAGAYRMAYRSAEQRNAYGFAVLGDCFRWGVGATKDFDRARKCYFQAAAGGIEKVTAKFTALQQSMQDLLTKSVALQRAELAAGESPMGRSPTFEDNMLHIAAEGDDTATIAMLYGHRYFDRLVEQRNRAGQLPVDRIPDYSYLLREYHRSILGTTRARRARCVLWCYDILRESAGAPLGQLAVETVRLICNEVGPPAVSRVDGEAGGLIDCVTRRWRTRQTFARGEQGEPLGKYAKRE